MFASIKRAFPSALLAAVVALGAAGPALAMGGGPGTGPYSGSFNLNAYGAASQGGALGGGYGYQADHGDAGTRDDLIPRHRRHRASGFGGGDQ